MIGYNGSVGLRNDGLDALTSKIDLNAAVGVLVTVRIATVPSGTGALASLFDINDAAIANPITTDNFGNYFFKIDEGTYDIITREGTPDVVTEPSQLIGASSPFNRVIPFDTLDLARADVNPLNIFNGASLNIKERTTGNGGGAMWGVVLSASVTPNTFDIVQCVGMPLLALKLRYTTPINVKQLGAVGDGINDDYPAIQWSLNGYDAAIHAYIPAGTYLMSRHLWLGINKKITGDGKFNSALVWNRDAADGAAILHDANTVVSDIGLVNIGTNDTTSMAICLWSQGGANGGYKSHWINMDVSGWGYGIASSILADVDLDPVFSRANSQMWLSTYDSIDFNANGRIIDVATSGVNAVTFTACFFKSCTGTRIAYINGGVGFKFDSCAFESPGVALDIEAVQSQNLSIVDCYFEPGNGIAADYCPNVSIVRPTITQEDFGALSNFAMFRGHTTSSLSWVKLPLFSRILDAAFNGVALLPEDRYWARNDSTTVLTTLSNCISKNDDFRSDGEGVNTSINGAYDSDTTAPVESDLPLNAVIETGSDATGRYMKFADGSMICETIDVDFTGFTSAGFTNIGWTYPVTFVGDLPSVVFDIAPLAGDINNKRHDSHSAEVRLDLCIPSVYVVNAFIANPKLSIIAKGRYKL